MAAGAETTSRPFAPSSAVAAPVITCCGATLPVAPGANTATRLWKSPTNRSPALSKPTASGSVSLVAAPPIVATGAALPCAPGAYSVTVPVVPSARLATYRRPVASKAIPSGALSPVELPWSVAIGDASPLAPGAYSVTEALPASVTNRSPAASNATPLGLDRPVVDPEIVTAGLTFPRAPGAYSVIEPPAPVLATARRPAGQTRAPPAAPGP